MKHILYASALGIVLTLLFLCSTIRIEHGVATSPYEYKTNDGNLWGVDAPYKNAVIIFNSKGTEYVEDDSVLFIVESGKGDR